MVIPITISIIVLSNSNKFTNLDVDLYFNSNSAYTYIEDQLNINTSHYRIPGTQGREDCAKYFITKFQEIDPSINYTLHNFTIHLVNCQNVLFKINENFTNILILGAHYDSRARATKDSVNKNSPVPGANDGASGSAVLIELAKVLYNRIHNLSVQIWFLFFDAEDQGYDYSYGILDWNWCEGSRKFVQNIEDFYNPSEEHFDAMILLDMVGGTNLKFISEQYSTSSLLNELFETGRGLGYTYQFPFDPIINSITDDHVSFVDYGIPSADLIINFWNNPAWPYHHTTEDNILHISNYSLELTGKTVEQFIYNNYLGTNVQFEGSYPWNEDFNLPDSDLLTLIIVLLIIIGITSVLLIYRSRLIKPKNIV